MTTLDFSKDLERGITFACEAWPHYFMLVMVGRSMRLPHGETRAPQSQIYTDRESIDALMAWIVERVEGYPRRFCALAESRTVLKKTLCDGIVRYIHGYCAICDRCGRAILQ